MEIYFLISQKKENKISALKIWMIGEVWAVWTRMHRNKKLEPFFFKEKSWCGLGEGKKCNKDNVRGKNSNHPKH